MDHPTSPSLYPLVQDLTETEYYDCDGDDAAYVMGEDRLQDLPLRPSSTFPQASPRDVQSINKLSHLSQSLYTPTLEVEEEAPSSTKKKFLSGSASGSFFGGSLTFSGKKQQQRHRRGISLPLINYASLTKVDSSDNQAIEMDLVTEHRVTFDEVYVLTRQVFKCDKSVIWECVERESNMRYCVKIIDLRSLGTSKEVKIARREVELLKAAQECPHVVRLVRVMEECRKIYIIMEFCSRGNLLTNVVQQYHTGFPEHQVKNIAKSILQACQCLHTQLYICHNDLQPSNILIDSQSNVKICDFGNALRQSSNSAIHHSDLNTAYVAPEVLSGVSYNTPEADMWTVGVLLYFMLYGQPPFGSPSGSSSFKSMTRRISKAEYSFPQEPEWNTSVSRQAKQFVSALIHSDPAVRLTAAEALEHKWLADVACTEDTESSGINTGANASKSTKAVNKKKGHMRVVSTGSVSIGGFMKRIILCKESCPNDLGSASTISSSESKDNQEQNVTVPYRRCSSDI